MAVSGAAQAARHQGSGEVSDRALLRVLQSGQARCAGSSLDPDEWFPVSPNVRVARIQAARAIALCTACPVRTECLEYAMRNWTDGSGEGVWGGLVAAERRVIRRRWLLGVSVTELLDQPLAGQQPVTQPPARAGAAVGGRGSGETSHMRDALNKQPIDMGDASARFAAAHVPEQDNRTFWSVRLCPRLL